MSLLLLVGRIIKEVSKKNKEDENVTTADPVVFEEVQKKLETIEEEPNVTSGRGRAGMYKDYQEKVLEAQRENEASAEVETADRSVFDDLLSELKKMQEQEQQGNVGSSPPAHEAPVYVPPIQRAPLESQTQPNMPTPGRNSSNFGAQAITNSAGSLELRDAPNMGAQKLSNRVPSNSLLKILGYSDNAILLDGKQSRFVQVEYQGQTGWILESYLNFH